jgi:hypothetical protein
MAVFAGLLGHDDARDLSVEAAKKSRETKFTPEPGRSDFGGSSWSATGAT